MIKQAFVALLFLTLSQILGCSAAVEQPSLTALSEALGALPIDAKLLSSGAQALQVHTNDIQQNGQKSRFWIVLSSNPLPIPVQRNASGQAEGKPVDAARISNIDVGPLKNFIAANYSEHSNLPRMDAAKATCIEWQNEGISIRLRECHETSQWLSVVEIIPNLHQDFTSLH